MNDFFITLGLKILEIYALFKIYVVGSIVNFYNNNLHSKLYFIRVFFNLEYNVEYIKNNETIHTSLIDNNYNNNFEGNFNTDFADFTTYNNNNNIKISYDKHFTNENINCELSNVNFFTFSVIFNDISYDIVLNKPHNYIICGNKLNHLFFNWYMYKKYNVNINSNYSIKYIDQTFQENTVKPSESLIFIKNKITVVNNNKKII
jgi:hypothetical protein